MRLFGFLCVLTLVLAAIGWFRAWYDLVAAGGATRPDFVVDRDQLTQDARSAATRIGQLTDRAQRAISGKTSEQAAGEVTFDAAVVVVDPLQGEIDLTVGNDALTLTVPRATPITIAGTKRRLEDLRSGQDVRVALVAQDDRLCLERIDAR